MGHPGRDEEGVARLHGAARGPVERRVHELRNVLHTVEAGVHAVEVHERLELAGHLGLLQLGQPIEDQAAAPYGNRGEVDRLPLRLHHHLPERSAVGLPAVRRHGGRAGRPVVHSRQRADPRVVAVAPSSSGLPSVIVCRRRCCCCCCCCSPSCHRVVLTAGLCCVPNGAEGGHGLQSGQRASQAGGGHIGAARRRSASGQSAHFQQTESEVRQWPAEREGRGAVGSAADCRWKSRQQQQRRHWVDGCDRHGSPSCQPGQLAGGRSEEW